MLSLNQIRFTFSFILEAEKGIECGFSLSAVTVLFSLFFSYVSVYENCKAVGEPSGLE